MNELEDSSIDLFENLIDLSFVLVDSQGGYEGEGEYVHRVFAIKEHENVLSYVKMPGTYYSYDGIYWGEFVRVYPREKTITVFEEKR